MTERTPLSIEYRTNPESYFLLLQSFVELAEKTVSTTTLTGTKHSKYSLVSRKFSISRAEYRSLHFNAYVLSQSMDELPCIDPQFVEFELCRCC